MSGVNNTIWLGLVGSLERASTKLVLLVRIRFCTSGIGQRIRLISVVYVMDGLEFKLKLAIERVALDYSTTCMHLLDRFWLSIELLHLRSGPIGSTRSWQ